MYNDILTLKTMEPVELANRLQALHNEALGKKQDDGTYKGVYQEYYDAKANYESLEQQTKTMLSWSEMKYLDRKPQAAITREALKDEDYISHLEGVKKAREAAYMAFSRVKSLEMRAELLRSLNRHCDLDNFN